MEQSHTPINDDGTPQVKTYTPNDEGVHKPSREQSEGAMQLDDKQINWVGIALIGVGVLFFFNGFNVVDELWRLAPLILVVMGWQRLNSSQHPKDRGKARRLMILGGATFLLTSGVLGVLGKLLPIAMVAGGLYLVSRKRWNEDHISDMWHSLSAQARRLWQRFYDGQSSASRNSVPRTDASYQDGESFQSDEGSRYADDVSSSSTWAVLGSNQKKVTDIHEVTVGRSVFGELEFDLRPLEGLLEQGELHVELQTVFGSATVIVPSSWRVVMHTNAILGEARDQSSPNSQAAVTVHIHGMTLFGETKIHN